MIKISNLTFSYTSQNQNILNKINITFNENEFAVILGPNGSGKTTLIKLMARFIKPVQGELYLRGIPYNRISTKEFYKKISYVPQKFFSIYPYTVFETVLMGRSLNFSLLGFEHESDIEKVELVLEELNLSHLAKKKISEISGGELQKVIIARAIVQDSEVILLDEPNTHLDVKHQIQIFELLKSLKKSGKSIIAVSHDINLASFYADRIILLKNGTIHYDGSIDEILKEDIIEEIFEIENRVVIDPEEKIPQLIIKPTRKRK